MQQTLFYIPHAWFDGRLLIGWLILGVVVTAFLWMRHGWSEKVWSFLPVLAIGAAIIYFAFPQLEIYGVDPDDPSGPFIKQGLAVRGYGVCLLFAIISGVGITLWRCRLAGIHPDQILSLAFWMTICGIVGARSLYVIQKSDEFFADTGSLRETIVGVLDMTKGGLVVYGSLIGGMLAAFIFFRVTKLSVLKTADLIAPGMVLGLAIGRIGCLMNGCCFGGLCEVNLPALQFPAGSPAYMQQLAYGDLLGLTTKANNDGEGFARVVTQVESNGLAAGLGIQTGDQLTIFAPDSLRLQFYKEHPDQWNEQRELVIYVESNRQGQLTVPLAQLADQSLEVHPTQIYSSINAGLLCLVLWFYWTVRRYDGEVFALMLILYSIARFLLEIVRRDESGLFDTSLTISQWVSVGTVVLGLVLMGYVRNAAPKKPGECGMAGN